jgi:hypothetical protein
MTPQQNPISTRLRQAREERNISPGDIQSRTSIRAHIIEAIDAGRFDELPPVYMRSFLRRYAEQVGVSANEIEILIDTHLDDLLNGKNKEQPGALAALRITKPKMQAPISLEGSPTRRRVLIFLVSIFGIACLAGIYLLLRGPDDGPFAGERNAAVRDVDSLLAPSQPAGRLMNYFGIGDQDSLVLEAVCTDTAWINITADGRITEAVTLEPGQQRRWAGLKSFQLSIRNAGGVTLKRNGTELPKVGNLGETVRSIRISKTEFITSASPWRSQRDTTKVRAAMTRTAPASPSKPSTSTIPAPNSSVKSLPSSGAARPAATSLSAPSVSKPRPSSISPGVAPKQVVNRPAVQLNKQAGKQLIKQPIKQPIKQAATGQGNQPVRNTPQQSGRKVAVVVSKKAASTTAARLANEKKLRLQRIQSEAKKRELTPVIIR